MSRSSPSVACVAGLRASSEGSQRGRTTHAGAGEASLATCRAVASGLSGLKSADRLSLGAGPADPTFPLRVNATNLRNILGDAEPAMLVFIWIETFETGVYRSGAIHPTRESDQWPGRKELERMPV